MIVKLVQYKKLKLNSFLIEIDTLHFKNVYTRIYYKGLFKKSIIFVTHKCVTLLGCISVYTADSCYGKILMVRETFLGRNFSINFKLRLLRRHMKFYSI